MAEKFVRASVADNVKEVVMSSWKILNVEKLGGKGTAGGKFDNHKGIVEAVLRGVATRIVLSTSFNDLGNTLDGALTAVKSGGMEESVLDQLKGRVLDRVKDIKDDRKSEAMGKFLEDQFKIGNYEKAVEILRGMAEDPDTGLSTTEQTEMVGLLGMIKSEADTTPEELEKLSIKNEELKDKNQEKVKKIVEKSDQIQAELGSEELKVIIAKKEVIKVDTKREVNDTQRNQVTDELNNTANLSKKDNNFIAEILIRNPEIDFLKMDRKAVFHIWYRTSGILGEKSTWVGAENTKETLKQMNESARAAILSFENENLVLEGMTPSEARWNSLPKDEQDLINRDLNFINRTRGEVRELLGHADSFSGAEFESHGLEGEISARTDGAMQRLIREYAGKRPPVDLTVNLHQNRNTRKWEWSGSREAFYDVCRQEVYGIQGQLTQENMGNLVFEESAQKYLALMRIDVGNDLELEKVKDAITKNLYIEFAVKTMWRSGGNMEAWQRAANVLTQDSEYNFFQLMDIGELLKATDRHGNEIEIGRFNWKDLMNVAEMKAENGQYFLTYMAGQSTPLREKRKPEFARAIAKNIITNRLLRGDLSQIQADTLLQQFQSGEYSFSNRQVRSMVDYMQFLEVATFRGGEFGINDSIIDGKLNLTSLPCGEVVQKTGPWALVYDWFYPVTKYGGEAVGKVFLPNVNVLSYRRGDTLAHFIAKDSKVASGMLDKTGEYHETGVGANEFFFDSSNSKAADDWNHFWGDVIFDTRTAQWEGMPEGDREMAGVQNKTAVSRTIETIRAQGISKLAKWNREGKLGFVESLNFENFEILLGYEIPGSSKFEKLKWMTENFDYSFWRVDNIPSKAIGDWVGKYVPKKYEESRLKLADVMNSPGNATLGGVRDIVSEYSDESTINGQIHAFLKDNRKFTLSLRMVDKDGNEKGTKGYDSSSGGLRFVGYKHADRGLSKWIQEGAGDYWRVTEQWHSATEGYHWGSGFATSRQQGKELFKDPMYFEKMEIDNQFHAGMLNRKEWGQAKREWQKKAYLGDAIDINGVKFRLGYIPIFTPLFLLRGWWVDRMQLDWQDFKVAFRKNNEETWEKLKKILGL